MHNTFAARNRKIIPVLLGILLLNLCALAQDLPTAKPESVGLSSERLQRIASSVQHDIDDKRIAGAVTLVVRHGHVAWFKSQGMMDREAAKPMQPDALFRICSMTKPITSVAVMMLYEEGRFLLDDPISKYLPEFKDSKVFVKPAMGAPYSIPATKEITIRDLLRHTSGLTYNWNDDLGPPYEKAGIASGVLQYDGTIGDNVKKLASIPLLFNPGDRFEYGLSVDVLGRLVEVVSGKPLDEFLRARIFEPLGMKDTYFYPPDNKLDRLATAYTYYPDKGLNRFPDTPIKEGNFSCSADYASRGRFSPRTLRDLSGLCGGSFWPQSSQRRRGGRGEHFAFINSPGTSIKLATGISFLKDAPLATSSRPIWSMEDVDHSSHS